MSHDVQPPASNEEGLVSTQHGATPAPAGDPIADPGLPAHEPRPTDVDVDAE